MECKDPSFTERKYSTLSKHSFQFLTTFLKAQTKAHHEKLDACNISFYQSPFFSSSNCYTCLKFLISFNINIPSVIKISEA